MAVKRVEVPDIGTVHLYKRRGVRSIRLSVTGKNEVRVSLPYWVPYAVGLQFVAGKRDWVLSQRVQVEQFGNLDQIGKSHHLVFEQSAEAVKPRARTLAGGEIRIVYPASMEIQDPEVQQTAHRAALRALKQQATVLLIPRLQQIAKQHGFTYNSVSIKRLTSRWGSCSSQKDIVLNSYLMQLPWQLIDYVILHELTHTRIMAHGTKFWAELGQYVPNLRDIRRQMRTHRPMLMAKSAKHKL